MRHALLALLAVAVACAHASPAPAVHEASPVASPKPATPAPAEARGPAATAQAVAAKAEAPAATPDADPYLWLEDVDGARAMTWVKEEDAKTLSVVEKQPGFDAVRKGILEVLDSKDRIPMVGRRGEWLYNFWTDADHPRGLWRRTTLAEYRKASPRWQVLIDVDALGKDDGVSWVWHGAECRKPQYRDCLVMLSRGGADAQVVREFDVETRKFVEGGFTLPEAKSQVAWRDADTIYVGTDFGPGSMTTSGYPRVEKEWRRGTPLADAKTVYEAKPTDMTVIAWRDLTPGFERDLVQRQIDFWTSETFLRGADGTLRRLDVPLDAIVDVHREWMTVQLRSPWTVGGATYPAGALVATRFDDFMRGKRELTVLFRPDATTSLDSASWTRHHLILDELHDVAGRVEVLTPGKGEWKRAPLGAAPALAKVVATGADPDRSDEYFLVATSFLEPTTLSRGVIGRARVETLKREPAYFDASRYDVTQHFVASKDGTRVPYFMVAPKGLQANGKSPTLLYGYGGFEIALQPWYSGTVGRAWLERGGTFVVANIRGGGEFGPRWHEAALKANRPRAYEDFAAVAQDLVARGITSPRHLGASGGSNGGLLVGNMLTLYPKLFGAILCEVPLLDMKRYTHIAAGASWIAEYGDPDDPKQWAFIRTFSPYQNVRAGEPYPPVLFTTTTRDDRVGPQHARKMAAKMQAMGDDALFYENTEGGHGAGADNRQKALFMAVGYQFLWDHLAPQPGGTQASAR